MYYFIKLTFLFHHSTSEPRPSAFQKSLTKLKGKLSPKPDRASPSLSDPSASANGDAPGSHQTTATLRPQKRSLRDRILSRSLDPRSASYRVESEGEGEEIPTVSRRLDYGQSAAAPSRTGASDGEVNDFNDITLIPTNIRESSGITL